MPKPLRDPRALSEEAAAARGQARALHDASTEHIRDENLRWGTRRDETAREAAAARSRADAAGKQADELSAEGNRYAEMAGEHDARGSSLYGTRPLEAEEAFEDSQGFVRMAEAVSQRAEVAREEARTWGDKADQLEADLRSIEGEGFSTEYRGRELSRAADVLDEKSRLLEEAAQKQRDSESEYDAGEYGAGSASNNWAQYAQERADALAPDYSGLDSNLLMDAGVPRSEIPGSELMDPTYDSYDDSVSYDDAAYDDASVDGFA